MKPIVKTINYKIVAVGRSQRYETALIVPKWHPRARHVQESLRSSLPVVVVSARERLILNSIAVLTSVLATVTSCVNFALRNMAEADQALDQALLAITVGTTFLKLVIAKARRSERLSGKIYYSVLALTSMFQIALWIVSTLRIMGVPGHQQDAEPTEPHDSSITPVLTTPTHSTSSTPLQCVLWTPEPDTANYAGNVCRYNTSRVTVFGQNRKSLRLDMSTGSSGCQSGAAKAILGRDACFNVTGFGPMASFGLVGSSGSIAFVYQDATGIVCAWGQDFQGTSQSRMRARSLGTICVGQSASNLMLMLQETSESCSGKLVPSFSTHVFANWGGSTALTNDSKTMEIDETDC